MLARVLQGVMSAGRRYGVTRDMVVLGAAAVAASWGATKLLHIADQAGRDVVERQADLASLEHSYAAASERYRTLMQDRRQWLKDNPHPAAGVDAPLTETIERVHEGLKKL